MRRNGSQNNKKTGFEDESAVFAVNSPLLLEASAGSGKTTVLVERYLASVLYLLLFEKKSPYESARSVVAVTFTRKAASEMKDRVRERIRVQFDENYLLSVVKKLEEYNGISVPDAKSAVRNLLASRDDLLQAVQTAPISTMHSFALSYLRRFPVESGIDPFAVTQDETGIEDLSITSADALTDTLRKMIREKNPDLAWMVRAAGIERVRDMLKALNGAVSNLGLRLTEKALRDEGYFRHEKSVDMPGMLRETVFPKLKAIRSRLEQLRETVNKKSVDPVKRAMDQIDRFMGKNEPEDIYRDELWYEGKTGEVMDAVLPLYEDVAKEKMKVFFPRLWRIYLEFWKTSESLKNFRKEISFSDIEIRFLDTLTAYPAIRQKIGGEIRFILVDEYQDTSDLQKEILDLLVYDDKKNLKLTPFMVGDPKQSIFGFRNANLEIFHATRKEMEGLEKNRTRPCYRRLNRNYRSLPGLVEGINAVFRTVFRDSGPAIEYRDQEAAGTVDDSDGGGACFLPARKEENRKVFETSACQASRLITQLVKKEGFLPGEIMVLLRKKRNIDVLKKALDETAVPEGIGYYVVEDVAEILDNREIRDLVIYLKALENRESDFYFLSLLKSPFFRKSDPEILELRRSGGVSLYDSMDRTLCGEMEIFNALHKVKNRLTIPELAEEIVNRTGYFAYLNSLPGRKEATTNLIVFLDFLRKIQDVEMFSLTDFLYYLQEYRVSPKPPQVVGEKSDVVRIMTIHMAKGLQAGAVIYIAPYQKNESGKIRITVRKKEGRYGVFVNLFDKMSRRRCDPMYRYLASMDSEEEKRLAYVAMTRAERRFYYFGMITEGVPAQNDCWSDFIRSGEPCFAERKLSLETIRTETLPVVSDNLDPDARKKVLDKLEYLRNAEPRLAYEKNPRIVTVTQLLDIEFIGEGFRNRYITRSFPVEEALNEIADLSDIFRENSPSADIGTYLHRVFQMSDAVHFREYIESTVGLEDEAILSNREKILDLAGRFYRSEFYGSHYAENEASFREFEVNFNFQLGADTVLIKGSVDQYLRKNGGGVLIDYKLSVPEDRSRYERQLHYYAYMLGELGYPVEEMFLFDIGQTKAYPVAKSGENIPEVMGLQMKKIAEIYRQAVL